jgi:hypothetical protein
MSNVLINLTCTTFRRLPILSGLSALTFNPIVGWILRDLPAIASARLRDGNSIEVATSDYHGRVLYLFGTNDPKVEVTTNASLKRGDVYLEIGANYSTIGLSASHIVGPESAVHLFEPQMALAGEDRPSFSFFDHPRRHSYPMYLNHWIGLFIAHAMLHHHYARQQSPEF